ncbi:MAG: cupin-like domain-containing protein [Bdellovibrionales bacterium]|nr:cupin-like domain-containing protein [Bdellovibrionales bacterium]
MKPLLIIPPEEFRRHFDREAFRVEHSLVEHPLLQLPRLVDLARTLPAASVEYNAGDVPVSLDPTQTPRTGLSPEETVRRIRECRSWIVLKNVQQDSAYRELLDNCLQSFVQQNLLTSNNLYAREAFIFISSPDAVTPYHMDPEHNFLLQVHGKKVMHIFSRADRSVLSEADIENFYLRGSRNMNFADTLQSRAQSVELAPGQGLHIPANSPHWVKVLGDYSISLSVTFRSRELDARERLYRANGWLRWLGFNPAPPGTSGLRDQIKIRLLPLLHRLAHSLGRARD